MNLPECLACFELIYFSERDLSFLENSSNCNCVYQLNLPITLPWDLTPEELQKYTISKRAETSEKQKQIIGTHKFDSAATNAY